MIITAGRRRFADRRRFELVCGLGGNRRMRQRGPAHPAKTILRAVVVPAMGTVYVHSLQHSVKLLMAESLLALERYLPGGRPGWGAYRGPAISSSLSDTIATYVCENTKDRETKGGLIRGSKCAT